MASDCRRCVDTEIAKLALHVGLQDWVCKRLVLLHVAASATALFVQSWWQANIAGIRLPSLHASAVDVEIEKIAVHIGVQDWPCKALVLLHVAALATALVMQS